MERLNHSRLVLACSVGALCLGAAAVEGQVITPLPASIDVGPIPTVSAGDPLFAPPALNAAGIDLLPPPPPAPSTPLVPANATPTLAEELEVPVIEPTPSAAPEIAPEIAPEVAPEKVVEDVEETVVEAELSEETEAFHWYQPQYWFGPSPWDSGIELGLNGASGTSESISFRTGGYVKRKADDYKFNGSLYYNKTQSEGVEIQSNALLDLRYDWLFDDSPWTLFVMSQTFYDEFQVFDVNFNVNTGFGYQWLDRDWTKLTTSVGTGASREFGGPMSEWVQEASFSCDYELKVGENKKFYAKADYFPEWDDFSNYRVLADVGMEFELHQPSNVSLKLSATDRYDSQPQGVEPHNLNYSALLIWKL